MKPRLELAKKTVAIVQARLGSSRLPLKSLINLRGFPIIDWVTQRLGQAKKLDGIVVAIPDTELDRALGEHLETRSVKFVAGSENDVLGRFQLAAQAAEADVIVRVCADNPLIWGEAIDRLINFYKTANCDYAYNHIPRGNLWPDGLGAEIISRETLEDMAANATAQSQREHCFNYIWDNPGKYRIATFDPAEEWLKRPDIKLDIDSVADFQRIALMPVSHGIDARGLIRIWDAQKKTGI